MLSRAAAALVLGLTLVALACSSDGEPRAAGTPSQDSTQTSEAGGITVEARWLTEAELTDLDADVSQYPLDAFLLFELTLDTHSGDLNDIDLQDAATLRQGQAEASPEAWVSESEDSHHRGGVLVFPRSSGGGPAELVITIGSDKVLLSWESAPGT